MYIYVYVFNVLTMLSSHIGIDMVYGIGWIG
jgi:hypothetical protein